MSKLSDFGKFLAKYAVEAAAIANGLRVMVSGIAIGAQEKEKLEEVIKRFETTAENVANAAGGFKETKVVVRKSDVNAAVSELLPAAIRAELIKAGLVSEVEEGSENGAS